MKRFDLRVFATLITVAITAPGWSQTCQSSDEMPDQTRMAIEHTAAQIVEHVIHGDTNLLRVVMAPSQQSSFHGIALAVNDNQSALEGGRPQLRSSFLLNTGVNLGFDGRFFCGVFGASGLVGNGAEFDLPGLPAGKYAIAIEDLVGNKRPYAVTTILQDVSGWKLAGLYIRPESAAGHDGAWYLRQARDYKNKGQNHNAWFYYLESWELMAPVTFMNTTLLGTIVKEANALLPKDVPSAGRAVSFSANGKTYNLTDMLVLSTDKSFDLSIKYSVSSTADFAATRADARSLANAYASQHPELKEAFDNVWVHAIDPNGGDVPGVVTLKPVPK